MDLADLPEGPVTLMFTDVEGSTALRTTLGDAESGALFREHDELIRQQIEENKGQDQRAALGDGFLAGARYRRTRLSDAVGRGRRDGGGRRRCRTGNMCGRFLAWVGQRGLP